MAKFISLTRYKIIYWFTNLRNLPKRYIRLLHYITTAIIMPHTICGLRFWKKARIMSLRKSVWVKHYIKKNVITKLCSNTKMQMSAHCILRPLQNIDTAFSEKISVLQLNCSANSVKKESVVSELISLPRKSL